MRSKWKGGEPAEGASERRIGARHDSVRRRRGVSSGHPRRECREMAPRGETEKLREKPGTGRGKGAVCGRRRMASARRHGENREVGEREM